MPDESVQCCITSPPYWGLRAYGGDPGMIGMEPTIDEHLDNLVTVFRQVRRVLRKDGTLWLNYGDAYNHGTSAVRKRTRNTTVGYWRNAGSMGDQRVNVASLKPKDLMMMPARVAMALQSDGWWLRSEIIWHKPNPMPESVRDRPTAAHEKVFLLSKSLRYFYDAEAVRTPTAPSNAHGKEMPTHAPEDAVRQGKGPRPSSELRTPKDTDGRSARLGRAPGWRQMQANEDYQGVAPGTHRRPPKGGQKTWDATGRNTANLRDVWTIPTQPYREAHFATFPEKLVTPCIKAGCPEGGVILDPFAGSGTVGLVAYNLNRCAILIEINPEYCALAHKRIEECDSLFADVRS